MAFEKIKISGRIKLFILFILQFPPTGRGDFGGFQSCPEPQKLIQCLC